jgi:drug/metabolite transporter (DMT)-like permease
MSCALLVFTPFLRVKSVSIFKVLQLVFIGAVQYCLMYLCFLRSFQYLEAYQAALFTVTTPIYVILFNDVFEGKFNRHYMKAALLAVLGGTIIYYKNINTPNILYGFILVQLSDICFAFGQVAYKRLRANAPQIKDVQVYGLLFFGALSVAIFATTYSSGWHSALDMTIRQLLVLIYLGCIASGLCFFLWNKGAVTTNTPTLAVFNNLKSPLAITVSILFFHEAANVPRLAIGLSLIAVALFLAEKYSRDARTSKALS